MTYEVLTPVLALEDIAHNDTFDGFQLWGNGKLIYEYVGKVVFWARDVPMVAKFGDNLPTWTHNPNVPVDTQILTVVDDDTDTTKNYLTIGY